MYPVNKVIKKSALYKPVVRVFLPINNSTTIVSPNGTSHDIRCAWELVNGDFDN